MASSHKQKKRRTWSQLKLWELVVLLVISLFISATLLRLNNIGMIQRRDAVEVADKSGEEVELMNRLYDLQRYVAAHMNASPGQVALDHAYKRAYDRDFKVFEETAQRSGSGNDVVQKVRQTCDNQAKQGGYGRFWVRADPRYVSCINEEWAKYPSAAVSDVQFKPPSTAPYYQTFVSPLWSPDAAGWSVLVTVLLMVVVIVKAAVSGVIRYIIWRRYRSF